MDKEIRDLEGQEQHLEGKSTGKKDKASGTDSILDWYLKNASQSEETEAECVYLLKKLLWEMQEEQLLTFFDEIVQRLPENRMEQSDHWTEEMTLIRRLFTVHSSIFTSIYCAHLMELYHAVLKISEVLDLSQIPLFSTDPKAALYGHKERTEDGILILPPLKSDQIVKIMNAEIAEGRQDLAQKWICEIASYSKACLCDAQFESSSLETHRELKKIIQEDPRYSALLFRYLTENYGERAMELFERNSAAEVINSQLNKRILQDQQMNAALEEQKTTLQAELKMIHSRVAVLNARNAEMDILREKIRECSDRYQQQINMNEDLQRIHTNQIEEYKDELNRLLDEAQEMDEQMTQLQNQLALLKMENQNLKSDLASERSRTQILREDAKQVADEARRNIVGDAVNLLSEPINHFLAAFAYFQEAEEFEPVTLDICQADLAHLIEGLASFGAEPIGTQGEIAPYDRNIHFCEDHLENGEPIRVVDIGWMVNGNVILKAMTEKVEG